MEPVRKKAKQIGVPCILYNVDDFHVSKKGDELVKRYGDWSEDYLVPQVFLEYENGDVKHIFTGNSEDIELTRNGLTNVLNSHLFRKNSDD